MLARFLLALATLALLIAPAALLSGEAMAAPANHAVPIATGHCGGETPAKETGNDTRTQCCIAMCTALLPESAAPSVPADYRASVRARFLPIGGTAFAPELPTPPPRAT